MSLAGHGPKSGSRHMPEHSLNWTTASSAIQGWQRCQWCNSPTQRWPSRIRRPFGLKSAMEDWPSGTNARQSAKKSAMITITLPASLYLILVPILWNKTGVFFVHKILSEKSNILYLCQIESMLWLVIVYLFKKNKQIKCCGSDTTDSIRSARCLCNVLQGEEV